MFLCTHYGPGIELVASGEARRLPEWSLGSWLTVGEARAGWCLPPPAASEGAESQVNPFHFVIQISDNITHTIQIKTLSIAPTHLFF
jgi:hypothetical protein